MPRPKPNLKSRSTTFKHIKLNQSDRERLAKFAGFAGIDIQNKHEFDTMIRSVETAFYFYNMHEENKSPTDGQIREQLKPLLKTYRDLFNTLKSLELDAWLFLYAHAVTPDEVKAYKENPTSVREADEAVLTNMIQRCKSAIDALKVVRARPKDINLRMLISCIDSYLIQCTKLNETKKRRFISEALTAAKISHPYCYGKKFINLMPAHAFPLRSSLLASNPDVQHHKRSAKILVKSPKK